MSPEQREVEQEDGSDGREEGQDSPIACGDDIHLYDNQISPGPGQYRGERLGEMAVMVSGEEEEEEEKLISTEREGADRRGVREILRNELELNDKINNMHGDI